MTDQSVSGWHRVSERGLELTLTTLRRHGNQLSQSHAAALREVTRLFTALARGERTGRFVLDLPTGLGKTTSVVCWAKAMVEAEAGASLAICASRVEEICDVFVNLTSGEAAVPPERVGLWHSKGDAPLPPTFGANDHHRYAERPILLLTHERVRRGGKIVEQLKVGDRMRDLVVYDESLTTTQAQQYNHATLAGQITEVETALGHRGPVVEMLGRLQATLRQEVERQGAGEHANLVSLPFDDAPTAYAVLEEVKTRLGEGSHLHRLLEAGPRVGRLLLVRNQWKEATLLHIERRVPDELQRMIVLDASYPLRRLLLEANRRLASEHEALRLTRVEGLKGELKRYDRLTIHLMKTKGSGRSFVTDDMGRGPEGSLILAEIVAVVREIPAEEAIIIWTFLSRAGEGAWRELVHQALEQAGIDPRATVDIGGEARPRIIIETFGRETASNAYKHCTNVLFTGCLELAAQDIAGQLVAETRDLQLEVSDGEVEQLIRGEVYHRLYQAISRAACREVEVDQDGTTQAKATKVWLMSRHRLLQTALGRVFPGAQWQVWRPSVTGDRLTFKFETAVTTIKRLLDTTVRERIGCKTIKKMETSLAGLSNETFQMARDAAIEGTPWRVQGQSLVRIPGCSSEDHIYRDGEYLSPHADVSIEIYRGTGT